MKKVIHYALLASLVLGGVSSSLHASAHSIPYELPKDLYDQPMLKDPLFLKLSKDRQDKRILEHFNKAKIAPLNRKIRNQGILTGVAGAVNLLAAVIAYNLGAEGTAQNPIRTPGFIFGGLVGGLFSIPTFYFAYGLYNSLGHKYWNKKEDPLQEYEEAYLLKKRDLSLNMQNKIEEQLKIARLDETSLGVSIDFINIALNLPTHTKKAIFDPQTIKTSFRGYPDALREEVERFCLRQVANQRPAHYQEDGTYKKGKRVAAYFYGPPGSGKTRFAALAAKAMGLPFATLSLEGASVDDLIGRSLTSGNPTPGLILTAIANAKINGQGAKNLVLFIDEFDRNLKADVLPFILKLLDPETKEFYSPFLQCSIDISNIIIILAGNDVGNKTGEETNPIRDEALRKRLQLIYFTGFSPAFKKQIIWESTLKEMCEAYSQNGEYTLDINELRGDRESLNRLVDIDKDPGFRTIEGVLLQYLDYKLMNKYFDKRKAPDFIGMILRSNEAYKKMTSGVNSSKSEEDLQKEPKEKGSEEEVRAS